jgi:hypothetical protein
MKARWRTGSGWLGRAASLGLASLWLAIGVPGAGAQNSTPPPSAPQPAQSGNQNGNDNPFPGAQQKAPAPAKPQTPAPAGNSDNPFPGEDSNAPIIPVDPQPGYRPDAGRDPYPGRPAGDTGWTPPARRDADPDGDPVRSPDQPGVVEDDGFSSSRSGMPSSLPEEDDNDGRPGKSVKNKTREQLVQEDLDVGGFYLEKKNWKAAQARFTAAFGLDHENADAVWGLAESERHLELYKQAADHYNLFLSYDPQGPHGRAARKALNEVESAAASSGERPKQGDEQAPK